MSVAAAAIAGGAAIGGTALNMLSGKYAVQKQIEWERERAKNAHQWEVQDLQKAGLNPILSAGGQGATTGGISAPIPDTSGLQQGVSNAIQAYAVKKDNELKDAQITNTETNSAAQTAQTQKTIQETISEMKRQGLISAQTAKEYAETGLKQTQLNQARVELMKQAQTLQTQIEQAKIELEKAHSERDSAKAKAKQDEIDAKTKWVDKIVGYIEKLAYAYGSVAVGTSSVARTASDFIPINKGIGFVKNAFKK